MLQPTDTILYIELPNISALLDHTESCLGVFHFNWLAKKFCLISNRANIIGCWVFASSCLGWDMTITSLILRFHDDSQIPWWQPDYYFCFYSTVFFGLLACVASVSSRVRARNFLFFCSRSSFLDELARNRLLRRLFVYRKHYVIKRCVKQS